MNELVRQIGTAMSDSLGAPLAVMLLSLIPIAEARLAILFGASMGLSPGAAFGYAFLGSSLVAPLLLTAFIPIINALSKTKLFSRVGSFLYDKFEKKSRSLAEDIRSDENARRSERFISRSDLKKMGGTALFVAIPLPLTGVWTGSAVASILKIGFFKSLAGVIVGNAAACGIMTLISFLFKNYVDWITGIFAILVALVIIFLIIKFVMYKPDGAAENAPDDDTKTE